MPYVRNIYYFYVVEILFVCHFSCTRIRVDFMAEIKFLTWPRLRLLLSLLLLLPCHENPSHIWVLLIFTFLVVVRHLYGTLTAGISEFFIYLLAPRVYFYFGSFLFFFLLLCNNRKRLHTRAHSLLTYWKILHFEALLLLSSSESFEFILSALHFRIHHVCGISPSKFIF